MSKDTTCPYCGADVEINHDDGYGYNEDDLHQQECGVCEKTFTFTTTISFSYRAAKADCLNGGEHDYHKTKTYPPEFARLRCSMCDDERPLPPNGEVRGAPPIGEASSGEAATSTVVLEGGATGRKE